MTSAYILIAAMLFLGGVIAVLGDRLGSKIGKARLRLFNLRPRQTAQLVTILTGTLISASTFGILFALSESLRKGVFELDDILAELREVRGELDRVRGEREKVQQELSEAKTEQGSVEKRLRDINQNFEQAREELKIVSQRSQGLQTDIKKLMSERQQLLQQREQLDGQIDRLQVQVQGKDKELTQQEQKITAQSQRLEQRQIRLQELEKRQSALQAEVNSRDKEIAKLDNAIATRDSNLKNREAQLKDLEAQQAYLKRELDVLEQYYQTYQELRERQIAIVRGQVLAFAAVRVIDPKAVVDAIDQLLRQANRSAIEATRPDNPDVKERVVGITKAQVEQLVAQIKDGNDYVVRILSAGNYVQGEKEVRVFTDVVPNQKIFNRDETIATISIDTESLTEEDFQKRLDTLLAASQFRARRAGILGSIQVEDGRIKTILNFIEEINQIEGTPDEIKAIASNTTYTIGPLKLRLIAIKDGKVIFST